MRTAKVLYKCSHTDFVSENNRQLIDDNQQIAAAAIAITTAAIKTNRHGKNDKYYEINYVCSANLCGLAMNKKANLECFLFDYLRIE